jgi:hypothetical protein
MRLGLLTSLMHSKAGSSQCLVFLGTLTLSELGGVKGGGKGKQGFLEDCFRELIR